jgi:glutamine cyclotransferase
MLRHYKRIPLCFLIFVLAGIPLAEKSKNIAQAAQAPAVGCRIIASYPHDPDASTQGLVIDNGVLYEGTGIYGRSTLRMVDLQSGKVLQVHHLASPFFGEGITVFGNRIIQLTWKAGIGFVYDKDNFKLQRIFKYPGEGWGLTHDGKNLIMSDGSAIIRFLNPETFEEEKRITVTDESGPVTLLNELEYVHGTIYANVWKTERIALIDPESGKVTGWLDLASIVPKDPQSKRPFGVLNGIAYDADTGALYVTGKLWPLLFQIETAIDRTED